MTKVIGHSSLGKRSGIRGQSEDFLMQGLRTSFLIPNPQYLSLRAPSRPKWGEGVSLAWGLIPVAGKSESLREGSLSRFPRKYRDRRCRYRVLPSFKTFHSRPRKV